MVKANSNAKPQMSVQMGVNEMQASLTLSIPENGHLYTVEMVEAFLNANHIIHGIRRDAILKMIQGKVYNKQVQVAWGTEAKEGTDGYYDFNFKYDLDGKPEILEDGSVDYRSVNRIETVEDGQVIATYHPAVQGEPGMTVTGKNFAAKVAREQPPLKGKGFDRSEDGLTYTAAFPGKITMQNGRIIITKVYEISEDVDLAIGDIAFSGDVIVHGNVCTGVCIQADGSITVDGIVEAASLWSGKDMLIRGGVTGDSKAEIFVKGNLTAKFVEYAKVEVLGDIQADVFMNCEVKCKGKITLIGRKASIVGGCVSAVLGIETGSLGNEAEIETEVQVGNDISVYRRIRELEKEVEQYQLGLDKLEIALRKFEALEAKQAVEPNDPRKAQVLRVKVRDTALMNAARAEMSKLQAQVDISRMAVIRVHGRIYPGVEIIIDEEKLNNTKKKDHVEFRKERGEVMAFYSW